MSIVVKYLIDNQTKETLAYVKLSDAIAIEKALKQRVSDLEQELARSELLISMADQLITNENAIRDWTEAKKARHQ